MVLVSRFRVSVVVEYVVTTVELEFVFAVLPWSVVVPLELVVAPVNVSLSRSVIPGLGVCALTRVADGVDC